jgi:hypothetical protein
MMARLAKMREESAEENKVLRRPVPGGEEVIERAMGRVAREHDASNEYGKRVASAVEPYVPPVRPKHVREPTESSSDSKGPGNNNPPAGAVARPQQQFDAQQLIQIVDFGNQLLENNDPRYNPDDIRGVINDALELLEKDDTDVDDEPKAKRLNAAPEAPVAREPERDQEPEREQEPFVQNDNVPEDKRDANNKRAMSDELWVKTADGFVRATSVKSVQEKTGALNHALNVYRTWTGQDYDGPLNTPEERRAFFEHLIRVDNALADQLFERDEPSVEPQEVKKGKKKK